LGRLKVDTRISTGAVVATTATIIIIGILFSSSSSIYIEYKKSFSKYTSPSQTLSLEEIVQG
jgi:hypothetical protein